MFILLSVNKNGANTNLYIIIRNNHPSCGNHLNVAWFWVIFRVLPKSPFWLSGILTIERLMRQIRRILRCSTQSMDKACSYVQQMYVGVTNPPTSIPQHVFNRTHVEAFMQSRVWTYNAFSNNVHKAFSLSDFGFITGKLTKKKNVHNEPQSEHRGNNCALQLCFPQRLAV